jgi:hypothetical protein
MEVVMIITVRCFFIPADITFDTKDVCKECSFNGRGIELYFVESGESSIIVDREHYLAEKAKNNV